MSATLGIGTATFIPSYGPTAVGRPGPALLSAAIDAGVRYIDTAAAYGDSEAAIGEVADRITAHAVRVVTKIQPAAPTVAAAREAMQRSLDRLHLPGVDTVMLHSARSEAIAGAGEMFGALRDAGLAQRVGASTYGAADACAAAAMWCDTLQVEFSVVNPSVVTALRAAPRRPEVIARSVLCKGLLTPAGLALTLPQDARDVVTRLSAVAARHGMDLTTLAIRFALDTPGIDVVLVGVSTTAELDTALRAWQRPPLTAAQYAEVAAFDYGDADWAHPERWPEGRPAA